MRRRLSACFAVVAAIGTALGVPGAAAVQQAPGARAASDRRPIPYPVTPPARYRRAIDNGTRTNTGEPGPEYWQQTARYSIDARLDTEARRVDGHTRIVYWNHSPRRLTSITLMLYQNLHAEGAARHSPQEVTGGMEIRSVAVNGAPIPEGGSRPPRYLIQGTRMPVFLRPSLRSGDSVTVEVEWGFEIPHAGANGRMGWDSGNLFYLAYWYPQVAVFDDVVGWHTDPFTGRGEFYADFADYDVRLDVPEGWVVVGTGTLQNPDEVLPAEIQERLRAAEGSDEIVHVLTPEEFGTGRATRDAESDRLTWHLRAERVRDVALSVTRESRWDAVRVPVGDRDGDGATDYTRVDALYRPSDGPWTEAARYARHAIRFLSAYLELPYPWPHMTVVEGGGIIGGGMEYPMMTLIGTFENAPPQQFYATVAHELGHMWMPMIVNSDETRWAWMDEGTTSFNESRASKDFSPDSPSNPAAGYAQAARVGFDGTMMRWTDWEYPGAWGIAAYAKPAAALVALRTILGDEVFHRAYRKYIHDWAWKHPKPWDFFQTFETVSGQDLEWFWRSWFYERWTMDQAVASVEEGKDGPTITVEDRGDLPIPVFLTVTRDDGTVETHRLGVEAWLNGSRSTTLALEPGAPVVRVELDPERAFPDVKRSNNVWKVAAGN